MQMGSLREKSLIFFVDDEQEILEIFMDEFSEYHRVKTFDTPGKLLEYFSDPTAERPNVIVTDLKMGKTSGMEMVAMLNQHEIFCPIILLSGNLDKESLLSAVNTGVLYVLEKPFQLDQLRTYVDQILIESRIRHGQIQMRKTMDQLKELYGHMRVICATEIPRFQELMAETLLATGNANLWDAKEEISFESLLEKLEADLEMLMRLDDLYDGLRVNKLRSPSQSPGAQEKPAA